MDQQDLSYLTAREVADYLRVRIETVHSWIRKGQLPAYRLPGGRFRIVAADIQLLLKSGRTSWDPK